MLFYRLSTVLDLFGEGDGGAGAAPDGAAAEGGAGTGVNVPDAGGEAQTAAEKPEQSAKRPWDEIRGDYKDEIGKIVQGRVGNLNKKIAALEGERKNVSEILELVADNYGITEGEAGFDLGAIRDALKSDRRGLQERALENGVSEEMQEQLDAAARLKRQYDREEKRRQMQQSFDRVLAQTAEAQKLYPSLDINTEMDNPDFARLVANGVPVRTAYEVVHRDDIMRGVVSFAEKQAEQRVAASVAANGARPAENGSGAAATATGNPVPVRFTPEKIKEIADRARRGERVVL